MRARFITKCSLCRKKILIGQEIDVTYSRAVHTPCGDKLRQQAHGLEAEAKNIPSRIEPYNSLIQAALDQCERAGFR
jgi:hypothetical protein